MVPVDATGVVVDAEAVDPAGETGVAGVGVSRIAVAGVAIGAAVGWEAVTGAGAGLGARESNFEGISFAWPFSKTIGPSS